MFVAVGGSTPYVAYSLDGKNWIGAAPSVTTPRYRIAWAPELGILVLGGSGAPYLSYLAGPVIARDQTKIPTTWTAATTSTGLGWQAAAWSPQLGVFVAVGSATPYMAYSTDGKNWTAATTAVGTAWEGVAWSPQLGLFAAVGSATPYTAWSTDGKTIYFTSDRAGTPQIYKVPAQGGEAPKRVSFGVAYASRPRMSPDGTQLALAMREGGAYRIGVMDVTGGQVRVLSRGTLDESPAFAPNGAYVIFAGREKGQGILEMVSVDGQVTQRLKSDRGTIREPVWGPLPPACETIFP